MANTKNTKVCTGMSKLVFACSGAADTAEISDRAARKITTEGKGRMFCLAGIGGKIDPIMAQTKSAERLLVIDGCPLDCAAKTLELAGFKEYLHIRVTDLGMEKGKSPLSEERISLVAEKAGKMLHI